jgi:hypothetical protein
MIKKPVLVGRTAQLYTGEFFALSDGWKSHSRPGRSRSCAGYAKQLAA